MAKLSYVAHNGDEVSIHLPAETGFTARIAWHGSSIALRDVIRTNLAKAGLSQLPGSDGDHVIYNVTDLMHLVYVVQPRQTEKRAKSAKGARPPTARLPSNQKSASEGKSQAVNAAMLIHRGDRAWIIMAEGTTQLRVNQKQVSLMKIVKEGMQIRLGVLSLKFHEVETERFNSEMSQVARRRPCPFCQGQFEDGEEIIRCPSCGTIHHTECWEEYGSKCSGPPGCRYGVKAEFTIEDQESEE